MQLMSLIIITILLLICKNNVNAFENEEQLTDNVNDPANSAESSILKAIEKFQAISESTGRRHDEGILPTEDSDAHYEKMVEILTDIIERVKNTNNADTFLKNKGLDRIVAPNILDIDDELKVNILILLKILFEVSPVTTKAVIPTTIVDGLMEIFEKDNLALKAYSLDVLCLWLPGNPIVQGRVMKMKGLEPFYEQIPNLDSSGVRNLLDLFNKIINEHLQVRNAVKKGLVPPERAVIYQRIGLIERMSTPLVCNGLLNIFTSSWNYNTKDNNLVVTVFEVIKNIKQFCTKIFRGKAKAIGLFNTLQEHLKDPNNHQNLEANAVNIAEMTTIIDDYVKNVKLSPKDEF